MKKKITVEVGIETNGKFCSKNCDRLFYINTYHINTYHCLLWNKDLLEKYNSKIPRCNSCLKATGDL